MDSYLISTLFEWSYTVVIIILVRFFILRSARLETFKQLLTSWIVFGFVVNFYGLSWLYTVYPLPWMEEGVVQIAGIALLHLILSCATAVPYGVLALSAHKKIRTQYLPLAFATLLTVAELVRALIISALYYGNKTTIGLHFTAGTIGNALSTTPFIEFAYFGGTFALTFVLGFLVYTNSTVWHFGQYWKQTMLLVVTLLGVHFFVPVYLPERGTTVGIISTNFKLPKEEKDAIQDFKLQEKIIHKMTLSLASSSPSIVVYPEDTRYVSHLLPEHKTDLLIALPKTLLVDGDTIPGVDGNSNVSLFYSPTKTTITVRGKELLMPFNEYIPYFFEPLFASFVEKSTLDTYKHAHSYVPEYSDKTITFNGIRVGTLLCSEILSFSLIEKLQDEKPSIIVFQSRLDVFHNNPWFIMHLRSFTKVAAAETRTTLISSTSNAPSFIISPFGSFISYTKASTVSTIYTFK